jgi:hypothetical protein
MYGACVEMAPYALATQNKINKFSLYSDKTAS